MSQTSDLPVSLSRTLVEWDSSLAEHLNEDIPCEDGENGATAAMRDAVCLFYLGLQPLTQSGKLLVTGVHP